MSSPSTTLLAVGLLAGCLSHGHVSRADDAGRLRVERDVPYASPGGAELLLDVYLPEGEGPFPAVLVVHGGGWATGSKGQLGGYARMLARRGYVAFAISYRLAPAHPFPAQIEDCRSAVRWIRAHADEYRVDPDRIGGIGYSAGGHLVALLGVTGEAGEDGKPETDTRLQAVAAGGAPCDLLSIPEHAQALAFWLGGTRAKVPETYRAASPAAHATKDAPPMFFFHGDDDKLVPIRSARCLADALEEAGVEQEFYAISGAGHVTAMFNIEALERAIAFFDKHLKEARDADTDESDGA